MMQSCRSSPYNAQVLAYQRHGMAVAASPAVASQFSAGSLHGAHQRCAVPMMAKSAPQAGWQPQSCELSEAVVQQHLPEGLARVEQRRLAPTGRDNAYIGFLQAISSWGLLASLPLGSDGALHVNVPFCGGFSEGPLLMPCLVEKLPILRATSVTLRGSDLEASQLWWATQKEWVRRCLGSRARLEFSTKDLVKDPLPSAGLTLAVHPGPKIEHEGTGGVWHQIVANVLQSRAPGGRCIFATFFIEEARALQRICQWCGVSTEVHENPYYGTRPLPTYIDERGVEATPLRYVLVT
mmetsp:Transcript_31018/g.68529  ORF Transcript_31018/g.68529 Transcript_31018/m.68529 type:complete len:295 (-) Transcript_31018:10-894(-)